MHAAFLVAWRPALRIVGWMLLYLFCAISVWLRGRQAIRQTITWWRTPPEDELIIPTAEPDAPDAESQNVAK
jgi:hypothetical protein